MAITCGEMKARIGFLESSLISETCPERKKAIKQELEEWQGELRDCSHLPKNNQGKPLALADNFPQALQPSDEST